MTAFPRVTRLHLGSLELPPNHPRTASGPCDVFAYLIHHADGLLLVDTGVGIGNDWIDQLYHPDTVDIVVALNSSGIDERDVGAVINTHLHFDHCGQNSRFVGTPVYAQAEEWEAARDPMFTVAEWADTPVGDRRVIDGDAVIADGITLLVTPGHTPGHQSVALEGDEGPTVIVGQCAYCAPEFEAGEVPASEMHNDAWHEAGRRSLERLHALRPVAAYFSHDSTTFEAK